MIALPFTAQAAFGLTDCTYPFIPFLDLPLGVLRIRDDKVVM